MHHSHETFPLNASKYRYSMYCAVLYKYGLSFSSRLNVNTVVTVTSTKVYTVYRERETLTRIEY
jgi:hypothetical protein